MAVTKTITGYFDDDDDGVITLTLTETASSVEDNKSTWTAVLKFVYSANVSSSASKSYSMTVNGTTYSGTFTIGSSSTGVSKTLKTVTGISVSHNTDGSKSFSISFSVGVNLTLGGTYYGTVSNSGTVTATTIARATTATLSSSSVYLGSSVTVSLPRASSSFTHKIEQNVSGSYATLTSSAGTSYTLTAATSWGSYFPSATSKSVTIRVTTYSGSTQIGSSMTLTLTVKISSSMIPTISSITATEATSGLASAFGMFIQSKSKLLIKTTAAGIYGSTIKTYAVTCDGNSYSGSSITTSVITSSGTVTIAVKVTDSRGKTASSSITVSVTAYSNPAISLFNAYRADEDGVAYAKGTSLGSAAAFNITSLSNLNTNTYKLEYKLREEDTWTTVLEGTGYTLDVVLDTEVGVLEANYSYDARLTITDYFMSTAIQVSISTAFTLINYNKNAMAIGKMSELEETLEIDLDTVFYNKVEGITQVGDIKITSSSSSASDLAEKFGGTWSLVNKFFTYGTISYTFENDNAAGTVIGVLSGNIVRLRVFFRVKVDTNDSTLVLETIDYPSLGFNSFSYGILGQTGYSDGGNTPFYYSLQSASGNLEISDVYNGPLEAEQGGYANFTINLNPDQMIDSFCNEFHYKRTA